MKSIILLSFILFENLPLFFTIKLENSGFLYLKSSIDDSSNPHEITLSENQKNNGKSRIIFSQDPLNYFYILTTPPLLSNSKDDFEIKITNDFFILSTKENSKQSYESMVKFIKPVPDNSKKSVEIEKNPDGYFTITLRISKNGIQDSSIKTHYKTKIITKIEDKPVVRNNSYDLGDILDELNKNNETETGKALIGMMNVYEDAFTNPAFQKESNQMEGTSDSYAKDAETKFNKELDDKLSPLNDILDPSKVDSDTVADKESFALNASIALDNIDNGDISALEDLGNSLNATGALDKGKDSVKKQMDGDDDENDQNLSKKEKEIKKKEKEKKQKEKEKKMKKFIKDNKKEEDEMKEDSKEQEEKKKEEEKEKKKNEEKNKVLKDVDFN